MKSKTIKRIVSFAAIISMTISLIPQAGIKANVEMKNENKTSFVKKLYDSKIKKEEISGEVTVIVQLEDGTVIDQADCSNINFEKFLKSNKAKTIESRIETNQNKIMSSISSTVETKEVVARYKYALNGFAIKVDAKDINAIRKIDGVKSVNISEKLKPVEPIEEQEIISLGCCDPIGTSYMYENGYTGQGMAVAIIDNGFDYNHEIFEGEISNPKYSRDDIKQILDDDEFTFSIGIKQIYRSAKVPFTYNYSEGKGDTYNPGEDHGTHVAGIAAGNNGKFINDEAYTGVAKDAQLVLMAVPSLETEQIISAVEDAIRLDVDAINASFGDVSTSYSDLAEAFENAQAAGIYVSASAGNSGKDYYGESNLTTNIVDYSTDGNPARVPSVTSVASMESPSYYSRKNHLMVNDGNKYSMFSMDPDYFEKVMDKENYEFEYCGLGSKEDFAEANVKGKIAFVDRGEIPFTEKVKNGFDKGAVAVIIINFEDELIQYSYDDGFASGMITKSDGLSIINSGKNTVSFEWIHDFEEVRTDIKYMSEFSSYGTGTDLVLKPDITAPGGMIYSSINDDEYGFMSGTSMASPHVTGAAAIFKQYMLDNYDLTKFDIPVNTLEKMVLTSSSQMIYFDEEAGIPYSPRLQGSGLLSLENAAKTSVYLEGSENKCAIELKDNMTDEFTLKFTAHNFGNLDVIYDDLTLFVEGDDYTETKGTYYHTVSGMRTFEYECNLPETITVKAGESKEISVDVKLNKDELDENMEIFENGFFIEGFVVLGTKDDTVATVSIPYMGFYGDWTKTPIMDKYMWSDEPSEFYGTYLGGFSEECEVYYDESTKSGADGCFVLGTNLLFPESFNEKYVGISNDYDSLYYNLCVSTTILRNICASEVSILNEKGKKVYSEKYDSYDNGKFSTDCIDLYSKEMGLKDGNYRAKYTMALDYNQDNPKTETIEMPFYIDSERPIISNVAILKKGTGTFLKATVTDNKYLMFAAISDESDEEKDLDEILIDTYDFEGRKSEIIQLNITGCDYNNTTFTVVDYAGNKVELSLNTLIREYVTTANNQTTVSDETTIDKPADPTTNTSSEITTTTKAPSVNKTIPKAKIIKVKKLKKKAVTISIKKLGSVKKYKIQYATNKKFTKNVTTVVIKKLKYKIKDAIKGKKYFVRVRGINNKTEGPWSSVKKFKIKK